MTQAKSRSESWIIISDVHLGGFDDVTNSVLMDEFAAIVEFAWRNASGLIINGDLFDYYMEYNGNIPEVVEQGIIHLKNYIHRTQQSVVYLTGNHDNWDEGYLEKQGLTVIHEELQTTIGSLKTFIAHGDGLNDPGFGLPRPWMHRMLRNTAFIRLFKLATNAESGNFIMKWFSSINRKFDSGNASTTKRIDEWALKMLINADYDVVIVGHHHHPRFRNYNNKLYLNSGCFYKHRSLIRYTNNRFELVRWDNQKQTFIPLESGNLEL